MDLFMHTVTANRVNRGGHRTLKRPPNDFPKGFQGLWWIYAPTAKIQTQRMADLSKPKKSVSDFVTVSLLAGPSGNPDILTHIKVPFPCYAL